MEEMDDKREVSNGEMLNRARVAFVETSKLTSRKSKKSAVLLAVNTVIVTIFLKGMPLHYLFRPLGQILLVVWVLVFAVAGFDLIALLGNRSLRRKVDRSS